MPDMKICKLLPDDKDITAMQLPESDLLVPSKTEPPESSISPRRQENQFQRDGNHQRQDQEEEQEQERLHYESRSKRKRECNDETSRVEFLETPRNSDIRCYCPPRPPRKPKATLAKKGRAMFKKSVVFLDLAREVESMFPPSILQDFGKKIKKSRS